MSTIREAAQALLNALQQNPPTWRCPESAEALRTALAQPDAEAPAGAGVPAGLTDDDLVTLRHARTFLTSREKMHPVGVEQWDEMVARLAASQQRTAGEAQAGEPNLLLEWAVMRWRAEVEQRPLVNKHRRTLDDTWRQVIRYAGGDPDELIGPSHDAMLAGAIPSADSTRQAGDAEARDAARDVLAERRRQVEVEKWDAQHDDGYGDHSLSSAAACYAIAEFASQRTIDNLWPWEQVWWKPKDHRSNLVRAGALILAEIERLDRAVRQPPATALARETKP